MRLLAAVLAALGASTTLAQTAPPPPPSSWPVHSSGLTDLVQWDHYSLRIRGARVFLWSGEFHYWRIPVPSVWRDLLQKIRAGGFNAVSIYGHWAYHAASPGALDFKSGAHDFTSILEIAKEVGLYVIWRPGPYVNAESTAGGFALWTTTGAYGPLRNNDTRYTNAWEPYMSAYNKLLAPHQITRGGNLVLVQIENEFEHQRFDNGMENWDLINYMKKLERNARDNGIEVPLFTNAPNQKSKSWSKDYDPNGAQDMYGLDSYPECWSTNLNECGSVSPFTVVDYHSHFDQVSPTQPSFLPEFQGGAYTPWGGPRGGVSNLGSEFANVFYRHNVAERVTAMSLYMLYGGANWGGFATNLVGTDYNYSAPISADRTLTPKYYETKLLGLFLGVAADVRMTDRIAYGTNYTTLVSTSASGANASALGAVGATELWNPHTGAGFYVLRHNTSASTETSMFKVNVRTSAGALQVPRFGGAVALAGRESKILVTDFRFANRTLLYSTAEVLTYTVVDGQPVLALWLPEGEHGEVAFKGSNPVSKLYSGNVTTTTDDTGNTVLSYTQSSSSAMLRLKDGTTLLLLSRDAAHRFWAPSTSADPGASGESGARVLVTGPYLVRTVSISDNGRTVVVTGDADDAGAIEVFAPASAKHIVWNGKTLSGATRTPYGALGARIPGPAVSRAALQATLRLGPWRAAPDALPERQRAYAPASRAAWVAADTPAAHSPNPLVRPATDVVLFADEYGFHTGVLLWRAEWDAVGGVQGVWVNVQGGTAFGYSLWLNGVHIGSFPGTIDAVSHNATYPFEHVPPAQAGQKSILTLVQDHSGHDQRADALQPRGVLGFRLLGKDGKEASPAPKVQWKVAGNAGGEANIDPVRGPIAEGGIHAERVGWHLPGFDDAHWKRGSPETGLKAPGLAFYRTSLRLAVPEGHDAMLAFNLSTPVGQEVRAQLYVNGYQYGKFVPHIGTQTLFPVPPGVLNYRGDNTVGLSLWAQGEDGGSVAVTPTVVAVVRSAWDPVDKKEARVLQPGWTKARMEYA